MQENEQQVKDFLTVNQLPIKSLPLAVNALSHPSFATERGQVNNQRLEFLGDAVLNFIVGEHAYLAYPHFPEGELSQIRSRLVCEDALYHIGLRLKVGDYILLGKGEETTGGRERKSIIADAVEALIGAYYLDSGIEKVKQWVIGLLEEDLAGIVQGELLDYKSRLQELVQSWGKENVTYQLLKESGPSHDKLFLSGVFYKNKLLAEGAGHSKKESEQEAAEKAIKNIKNIQL
jgi:ribonuclease-3